ncbi:hypothetical protein HMPREF1870_01921 [Bacteroidales bacterium KA00344]|nr:hypothetical protein HMPREF1870_01921 [Bacteroidales bacterium KA00344]
MWRMRLNHIAIKALPQDAPMQSSAYGRFSHAADGCRGEKHSSFYAECFVNKR